MCQHVPQVGAPDPEHRSSPIFGHYEEPSLDLRLEAGACDFNDVAYPIAQYLLSGNELLQFGERGVRVRQGEAWP